MKIKSSVYILILSGLTGCATLPSSGPTRNQIEKSANMPENGPPIKIVEIRHASDLPIGKTVSAPVTAPLEPPPMPTDLLGPGDVLDISIFETGVAMFTRGGAIGSGGATEVSATPGVQVQKLPPIRVDDNGYITVPYAGRLNVQDQTVRDVEAMVRDSLRGMSQNPQVLITLQQAITNSIIIGGEVARPGRLVLQTNRERLSDVVALTGGYRGNSKDILARIFRRDNIIDVRLNDLVENPALDMRVSPGDRITLISDQRSYSVLGASGLVAQLPFNRSSVSLAEAVASAGGTNQAIGDPAAIFLFRYTLDEQGNEIPIVYHLNMMNAGSYLLAQRMPMRDKDVLYFGNAAANQPTKAIQLISQLFSPILTITAVAQTVQNAN